MLIRDVAYGRLPKGRRVGLHVRFADWIDALPDGSEEFVEILAYHLEQACLVAREVGRSEVPPPVDRAVEALSKAGEKAEQREGLREAHRFYSRALELIPVGGVATLLDLRLRRARARSGSASCAPPRRSSSRSPSKRATSVSARSAARRS